MPFPDHPCPKCNSWIDPPAGTTPGEKIICPRCEDTIKWLGPAIPGPRVAACPPPPVANLLRANKRVASRVVVLMAGLAVMTFFFLLYTKETRRNRDLARAASDPRQAYLQWLPNDATVLLVCNIDMVRASDVGQSFLETDALSQKNFPLRKWVGHDLRETRMAILSALPERPLASLLFLQANHPIEEEKLAQRMKAVPAGNRGGRDAYRFTFDLLPLGPTFTKVNENTIALAILPKRLEVIPANAPGNMDNLSLPIRSLVVERVPRLAPVWCAGEGSRLEALLNGELLPGLTLGKAPIPRDFFNGLESFALWLELDDRVLARGEFLFSGEEEARKWEAELTKQPWFSLLEVKSALKGRWLTVQATVPKAWHELPKRQPGRLKKG